MTTTDADDIEAFERALGEIIADRLCDGCHMRLGPAPRRMLDGKQYHRSCAKRHNRPNDNW